MMWSSTVGLVNGKHRYLTAETFGFKVNSNGQVLKKRQQWTIEPFPENLGPDGSISSAASVSSQCNVQAQTHNHHHQTIDPNDPCILTFNSGGVGASMTSIKSSSNGSSASDQENCGEEHENIAIKSHLNKYLAVDSFGNVTCDSEEKTENARFTITICSMSQGRSKDEHIFWAFKNVDRGYYLGTTEDGMICCNAKMPKSRAELWHLHLIPARGASFFAIKSLGRKRFARVVQGSELSSSVNAYDKSQVQLDATISWGPETLFQLKYYDGGRYSILTSDCMYLTNEGKCLYWKADDDSTLPPNECLFTLEYHSGYLAFRDHFSHYLAAAGRSSVLRSRSIGVSRDELFLFESAPIQVSLKATFNNRWVSIKQGVDLSANQTESTGKFEIFQLTHHKQTQNWSIMTHDCNFWTLSQNTSTVSICKPGDYEGINRGQFKLVWSDNDATCSLKYIDSNQQEKWISARKSGQLFLTTNSSAAHQTPPVKFIMRFQNRKLLNLRPVDGSGFVGLKTNSSCEVLEANKTSPDSIAIEYSELNSPNLMKTAPKFQNLDHIHHQGSKVCDGEQPTVNMFNVRLNSTKMGQSVLERCNSNKPIITQAEDECQNAEFSIKEVELGIDDNNNCIDNEVENKMIPNGSVESTSAPSVASIINSFSNSRISNGSIGRVNGFQSPNVSSQQRGSNITSRASSSVSKLASSFNNGITTNPQQGLGVLNEVQSDIASVITSCASTASALSSSSSIPSSEPQTIITNTANGGYDQNERQLVLSKSATSNKADQLAQSECCYLKVISNDKYLVVGNKDSSIVCDATNKACAQSWILELRTHNSIAIRASDNHAYMQLGTNGTIFLSRCEPSQASLWEF